MEKFPCTKVGKLSIPRLIVGSNWFLGYSHYTAAKDTYIRENIQKREKIADVLEVFFRKGVNAVMAPITIAPMADAIKEAEQRTGIKSIIIGTPGFTTTPETVEKGFDVSEVNRIMDEMVRIGVAVCMPHQCTTDPMIDRCTRQIRHFEQLCRAIRERGMSPGLSTHMPEAIVYADETGLDVDTYIAMYNASGFMMPIEVDWMSRIINDAKKPVMTIKPMAAGQIRPFQALNFVYNTIRPQDMVTVGVMSPQEASELVELALSILNRRQADIKLQETRSKKSLK